MSSIHQSGHKMGFKPVRRNSTVKRPLPVPPPVPPIIPSLYPPRVYPSASYQEFNSLSSFKPSYEQSSPCAKIYTGGFKHKPALPNSDGNVKSYQQRNAINSKSLNDINDNKQGVTSMSTRCSKKVKNKFNVNITNSSVLILNHFDEVKVDVCQHLVQKQRKKNKTRRNKLEETRVLQVFVKHEEEEPKLSAASFVFRYLRTTQRSKPLRICDFTKVCTDHGCDKIDDQELPKPFPLIYETQEICLWLSDDGDYATEDVFYPSIGSNEDQHSNSTKNDEELYESIYEVIRHPSSFETAISGSSAGTDDFLSEESDFDEMPDDGDDNYDDFIDRRNMHRLPPLPPSNTVHGDTDGAPGITKLAEAAGKRMMRKLRRTWSLKKSDLSRNLSRIRKYSTPIVAVASSSTGATSSRATFFTGVGSINPAGGLVSSGSTHLRKKSSFSATNSVGKKSTSKSHGIHGHNGTSNTTVDAKSVIRHHGGPVIGGAGKDETTFYITLTIEQDDENDDLDDEDYDEFDLDGSRASGMAGNSSEGFPMTGASGSSSGSKSVGSREGGSSFYGQCGNGISQPNFSGNKISDRHLGKSVATASTSSTASEENVSQTISISGSSAKSGNGHSKFYVDSSWNNNGQISRGGSSGIASLSPSSSSAGTISPLNLKHDPTKQFTSVITNQPHHQVNISHEQQQFNTQQRKKSSVTRPTEAPPAPPKTQNSSSEGNLESSITNHEQLLSAVLLSNMDRRHSDVSDDIPPPLPTTSPPKLSPDSTLTWNKKERTPLNLDLPNPGFHFKTRRSSTHVDSPVTSENGSTSGISGSGSSNGSDATLVNAEETYTSSLFQTEPLYQFYDVSGGSHTIKMTPPSSTSKNVRDIISVVENMYESVNSPTTTNSHEIDHVVSLKKEYNTINGGFDAKEKKDITQINPNLSDIVLNAMAIQGKNRCKDMQVPEPPRRSKQRNNKTNAKHSARNSNSSSSESYARQNHDNISTLAPDNKYIEDSTPQYDAESKMNNNAVHTTSGRPTAMDLALGCNGGKRSMWGELREVVESGVLGTISSDRKKLQEAMFEVVTSEASYLKSLNVLIRHFVQSPKFAGTIPGDSTHAGAVIAKRDFRVLFSDIIAVRQSSEKFLEDLERRWQSSVLCDGICEVIRDHAKNRFQIYVKYCSNQVYQDRMITRLRNENPKFVDALRQLESSPVCQSLAMHSFLMLPMQRITRLPLLVDAIFNRLNSASPEYQSCKDALQTLNKLVQDCNESARNMERMEEMLILSRQLDFREVKAYVPLISASRWLVRRGEVTRVWWKGAGNDLNGHSSSHTFSTEKLTFGRKAINRTNYTFFLFTDLLAITKRKSDEHYVVVDHCPRNLVQMQEIDNADNLGIPGLHSSSKRDSVDLSFAWLTLLQSGHENKTVEWLLSFPAATTSASECDRAAWIATVTPRSESRDVTTSSNSIGTIQTGEVENEDEKIYEEWDCPQIEVTEEYNAEKRSESLSGEEGVLDMQKGDKANVLRKLSESGWYYVERRSDSQKGWLPISVTREIESNHIRARNFKQRHAFLKLLSTQVNGGDESQA